MKLIATGRLSMGFVNQERHFTNEQTLILNSSASDARSCVYIYCHMIAAQACTSLLICYRAIVQNVRRVHRSLSPTQGRVSITCTIAVLRTDEECKYIFIFSKTSAAWWGLKTFSICRGKTHGASIDDPSETQFTRSWTAASANRITSPWKRIKEHVFHGTMP